MKKLFFAIVAFMLVCMTSCTVIDNAEVGIKYKKFGLTDQGELEAAPVTGWIFYNPLRTSVFKYPVYVQRVDYKPFTVMTKDAAAFVMDPVLAYQINKSMAVSIFSKYRKPLNEIEEGYMRTCIYDAYRIAANAYTADQLMSSRMEFENTVRELLNKSLGEEGFIISEFTSQITPPESLRMVIDEKNATVQAALKAENEVKKTEANAKIAVAAAEGEAKALRIKADAEAYYNKTVSQSINELLVRQYAVEKWNGVLPAVSGESTPFVNLK